MSYFNSGTWNSVCAVCGFEYKANQLQKRWDGVYVCNKDFETRHILDFFQVKPEKGLTVPWTQHESSEDIITITSVGALDVVSLSASLTDTVFFYTTTGAVSGARIIDLPDANSATFKGISVSYIINLLSESVAGTVSNFSLALTSSSSIQGSVTVIVDSVARLRNVPSQNLWIRE